MICIMTRNKILAGELSAALASAQASYTILDPDVITSIQGLYHEDFSGAVIDESIASLPEHAWLDLLGSLGRRKPIFVIGSRRSEDRAVASRNSELLTYIENPKAQDIMRLLSASSALKGALKDSAIQAIPLYSTQVALHMLNSTGALSVITINATGFRKISIDYGVEAYQKLQDCFQHILKIMWGTPGCFRRTDMLMRRSTHSNTYYVFLEQSRQSHTVPAPGVLEKLADRIALRIQKEMWEEVFKPLGERRFPECINVIPEVSVGYATALHNPCVDSFEIVEHLLESSVDVAKVQVRRMKDRACELLHTLIQTKDLLYPNYQAVFKLQGLKKDMLDQARQSNSIAPMAPILYGFESLIRAKAQTVQETLSGDHLVHIEAKLLRPDILFELAHQSKVALELDQVCLYHGIRGAVGLPGKLMVNVLPRNLLHLERLMHLLAPRNDLIFEISESEGIRNHKLMARIRDFITKIGCGIAADDFGKGYASIDRIIQMKPEIIKLDRSLVEGIDKDTAKQSFVEGIVRAAKLANSMVLAEGVETWDEARVVQAMGADLVQGFLCHRPQSLEQILEQLAQAEDDHNHNLPALDSVA